MKYLISIIIAGIMAGLFPEQSHAQITELKQTVYGMDCAPCAHGLEQRVSKLEGVKSVTVSLNNELLEAEFTADNRLTLAEIRKSVEDSGFQPKEAELQVKGIITKVGDSFTLETSSDEKFVVSTKNNFQIKQWIDEFPQKVIVTGKTANEKTKNIMLMVQSVENVEE